MVIMSNKRKLAAVESISPTKLTASSASSRESTEAEITKSPGKGSSNGNGRDYYQRDIITPVAIPASDQYSTMKIMSWNIPGLRGAMKSHSAVIENLLVKHSPDLLCLQETKLQESHVPEFDAFFSEKGYQGYWSCSTAKKGYAGTVVLIKKHLVGSEPSSEDSSKTAGAKKSKAVKQNTLTAMWGKSASGAAVEGSASASSKGTAAVPATSPTHLVRVMSMDCEDSRFAGEGRLITVEMSSFFLVAAYVPNSGQDLGRLDYRVDGWDPYIRQYLKELEKVKPVIYTGDMNVGHLDLDIYNYAAKHIVKQAGLTPRERASFSEMLESGFKDAFRYFYPTAKGQFTYWSQRTFARQVNCGIRLDYFICSESLFAHSNSSAVSITATTAELDTVSSDLDSSQVGRKKAKKTEATMTAAEIVECSKNPIARTVERSVALSECLALPSPAILDCYIVHADTEPCSDHCPVALILKVF